MNRSHVLSLLAVAALLALSGPASAQVGFGVGAYGGYQWPIAQDDADPGGLFGLKGLVGLSGIVEIEPNITWISNGDTQTPSGGDLPAPDVVSYQLNANLKLGPAFCVTGGLGWASVDLPQTGSQNEFAVNFGIGIRVPVGPLELDASPRLLVINTESGASRKHALLMAGLNYRF